MNKKIKLFISIIISIISTQIFLSIESIAVESNSNTRYTDVQKALQEVAYAYYMRGPNIQYNSMKGLPSLYSPEEATSQNMNYMVCSAFTRNVYYDLLGIKIPPYTYSQLKYAKDYLGRSEVIAYGCKDDNGDLIMNFYDANSENNYKTVTNPSLNDIIPYLQIRRCNYLYRTFDDGV